MPLPSGKDLKHSITYWHTHVVSSDKSHSLTSSCIHHSFIHPTISLYCKAHFCPLFSGIQGRSWPIRSHSLTQNSKTVGLQPLDNSWSHWLCRWGDGQHPPKAKAIPGRAAPPQACSPVHTVDREPRPPEAGLCGEKPDAALGSDDQGSGPSCSRPLPTFLHPGHVHLNVSQGLELMSEPSSLPTCTCFLFQTAPSIPISKEVLLSPQLQKPEDRASPSLPLPPPCKSSAMAGLL